jgi:hypothetical protein
MARNRGAQAVDFDDPRESAEDTSGDAAWRERQALKKKRASWPWTLALGVLALGWGGWTRLEWQSRQHAISLRVLRQGTPEDKGKSIEEAGAAPMLEIEIPDAPASTDERHVGGPRWEMRVRRTAWRAPGKTTWIEGTPQQAEFAQQQLKQGDSKRVGGSMRTVWPRSLWMRFPPGDHQVDLEAAASFEDEAAHVWSGSTRAQVQVAVPTPTPPPPTRFIAGIERVQYFPGLAPTLWDTTGPASLLGPYTGANIGARLDEVQKIEAQWRDVPRPGEPSFPATVEAGQFISLRAVQRGHAPGDTSAFEPLTPQWRHSSRPSNSWFPSLQENYLATLNEKDPPNGEYRRCEVLVEPQDHEVASNQGVAPARVREAEAAIAEVWVFVRPQNFSGPIPPFDAAAGSTP